MRWRTSRRVDLVFYAAARAMRRALPLLAACGSGAALPDAAAAVLEHLHRVLADVTVRLEGRNRRNHDDVAACLLQRSNQRLHRLLAGLVDDVGEVVDRLCQLGREILGPRRCSRGQDHEDDKTTKDTKGVLRDLRG